MGMSAKMYVDGKVYSIYRLQYGFHQEINTNGTAATHPLGGLFDIELDSPKDPHLYAWGASNYQMKHVKLVFSQITKATRSRTIELYDTLCIAHHDYFSNGSKDPMRSVLKLSPAIIVQDGRIMFEKNWKVTDLSRQNVEPTPLPVSVQSEEELEELQPVKSEIHFESVNGDGLNLGYQYGMPNMINLKDKPITSTVEWFIQFKFIHRHNGVNPMTDDCFSVNQIVLPKTIPAKSGFKKAFGSLANDHV